MKTKMIHYILIIINFYLSKLIYNFLNKLQKNRLLYEENNINNETNTFCDNSQSLSCKNKYKTKKFILILSDGTSFDQLPYNYKPEEHNLTSVFKNYDTEFKITGGNFETEFTGSFSRNYYYHKITKDNFFRQLHRNGFRLSYLGIDLPVFLFLGAENNVELTKYKVEREVETIAFSNLCNFTFNIFNQKIKDYFIQISDKYLMTEKPYEEIYKKLDELLKEDIEYLNNKLNLTKCFINQFDYKPNNKDEKFGIIYYTTTLDNLHHKYSKKYYESILNAYVTNKYIIKIHNFINENPDFSLILISDHGGSIFSGDESINLHGSNKKGNEGIFTLYNNELGKNYNKLKNNIKIINRYNYAPTMAQIIEGINIPIYSIGKPLLIGNDNIIRYSAVKSKEEQVIQFLTKGRNQFNEFSDIFQKYENDIKSQQSDNIYLYDDNYYEKKMNKLINIFNKAEGLIHRKSNYKHFIFFFGCFFGYLIMIVFECLIFKNIIFNEIQKNNSDKNYFKLYTIIIIYFIPNILIFFFPESFHIMSRLRIGFYFSIFIFILYIISYKYNKSSKILIGGKILILIFFFLIVCYHSIYYIKYFFSHLYSKIIFFFIYYPLYFIYIYYDTNKELNSLYFDKQKKYSCQKIISILSYIFLIFIFFFDIKRIKYDYDKVNDITQFIPYLFIILFILNIIIIFIGKGRKINHFPLINLITFFINIYLLDESEKLCLLFFYLLCEFFIRRNNKTNNILNKLIYFILIILLSDIFSNYSNSNDISFLVRYLIYFKISIITIYSYFSVFILKNQVENHYLFNLSIYNKYFSEYDFFWILCFLVIFSIKNLLLKNENFELQEINDSNNNTEPKPVIIQ